MDQLPLALRWPRHQRFEDFLLQGNEATVAALRHASTHTDAACVYLAGAPGSGRSHLLMAVCQAAVEAGRSAQYLPLQRLRTLGPEAIRGLSGSEVLALDDIDAIAGDSAMEHALFDLYNERRAAAATLVFAASSAPAQLGLTLPDLVSRLGACAQLPLKPLDEEGRREVLSRRASARGLELDDSVLDWLFARHSRDLRALTDLLERLDRAALAAKRRVTVPFVRELLRGDESRDRGPGTRDP